MLIFGLDVPLVEILLLFLVIIFVLLIEAIVLIGILMKQLNHARRHAEHATKLSTALTQLKQIELRRMRLKR